MKRLASTVGLAFNATVSYHANSVYPSLLIGSYGPIGGVANFICMTFDKPQKQDFKQPPQVLEMVDFLAEYKKKERSIILNQFI